MFTNALKMHPATVEEEIEQITTISRYFFLLMLLSLPYVAKNLNSST